MGKLIIGDHSYLKDITNPFEINISIGKFCSISFSLLILGDDHACISVPNTVSTYPFDALWGTPAIPGQWVKNTVAIGNDVWIGMHVSIRPGIKIGDGAIIGAGSMVTKDVLPYEIVSGNPLQHMRYRFTQEQITRLLEIKWWDWPDDKIKKNFTLFGDIEEFVKGNFQ
jgi:acetyltransferase-like isoleucine patch superfamily enzyme